MEASIQQRVLIELSNLRELVRDAIGMPITSHLLCYARYFETGILEETAMNIAMRDLLVEELYKMRTTILNDEPMETDLFDTPRH